MYSNNSHTDKSAAENLVGGSHGRFQAEILGAWPLHFPPFSLHSLPAPHRSRPPLISGVNIGDIQFTNIENEKGSPQHGLHGRGKVRDGGVVSSSLPPQPSGGSAPANVVVKILHFGAL